MDISKGLLPDLGEQEQDKQPVISFNYDNTLDEIDGAMKTFQRKFAGKRGLLFIIAYALLSIAVIVAIILNPDSIPAYMALIFCLVGLILSATDKRRTRKKTIDALKDMNPEDYRASIFDDRIELETIIKPKENEIDIKIDENADNNIISPLKSVFKFGVDVMDYAENEDSLLLVSGRRQIYCFPKRCLTTSQEEQIRSFLKQKLEKS